MNSYSILKPFFSHYEKSNLAFYTGREISQCELQSRSSHKSASESEFKAVGGHALTINTAQVDEVQRIGEAVISTLRILKVLLSLAMCVYGRYYNTETTHKHYISTHPTFREGWGRWRSHREQH